jgi:putative ABC transport system permease protein
MHEHNERELEKIILPFTTLQKVYNYGEEFHFFILTAKPDIPVSEVEKKVKKLLAQRHSVSPDDDRAFGGFNMEEEFNKIRKLFFSIQGLMWIVGTGTLLSGVIGVSNIMLVIVRERTKEFGIKRAIGATPWSIISHIIMESVFLTSVTGFVGMVLGIWSLEGVALILLNMDSGMFRNPGVDIGIAVKALIILIVSGTLAGLIPAKRAISIKPIDAIRN